MPLESGSSLFGNQKSPAAESSRGSPGELAHALEELDERVIILSKEDFHAADPAAPFLDWSTVDRGQITVQVKDTEGLDEGNMTIKASTLQRIQPALLPIRLEREYLFPISLKTVVMQVQPHLRLGSEGRPKQVSPDIDTPIAQVAREDEGYFKLANVAEPKETPSDKMAEAKRKIPAPVLTPADRPSSPIERKKYLAKYKVSGPPLRAGGQTAPSAKTACPEREVRRAERASPKTEGVTESSLRRIGLERLREIFMTEDELDAPQVAQRLAGFPKVRSAIVMLGDGTVLGGSVPDSYDLETALLVPVIMQSVQDFNRKLRSDETSAFTLLGGQLVTLFAEGNVYILISHEGRGLLPGVRERIGEVARALDAALTA
jgi:hypothetical protein